MPRCSGQRTSGLRFRRRLVPRRSMPPPDSHSHQRTETPPPACPEAGPRGREARRECQGRRQRCRPNQTTTALGQARRSCAAARAGGGRAKEEQEAKDEPGGAAGARGQAPGTPGATAFGSPQRNGECDGCRPRALRSRPGFRPRPGRVVSGVPPLHVPALPLRRRPGRPRRGRRILRRRLCRESRRRLRHVPRRRPPQL